MSQTPTPTPMPAGRKSRPNIYTLMMIVSTLALITGCAVIGYQSYKLYGSNVFQLPQGGK